MQMIPMVLMAVGTIMQSNAQREQGAAQQASAEYNAKQTEAYAAYKAKQAEIVANNERASAQREMLDKNRRMNFALSRAQALAAASGAGAADPSVVNIMSGIIGEGELAKSTSMWEGESKAIATENQARADMWEGTNKAAASRWEGSVAKTNANNAANATLISGIGKGMTMMDKFSPGPAPTDGYYPEIANRTWGVE
jgi:hypothetical protein